jgi:hypothetical protein
MKTYFFLLASLWLSVSAQADVMIYKGTYRYKSSEPFPLPPATSIFVVVDYEARRFATLYLFSSGGQKKQAVESLIYQCAVVDFPGGRTQTMATVVNKLETSPMEYAHSFLSFRGFDVSQPIANSPALKTARRPRVLTGLARAVQANGADTGASESSSVVSLQKARTIAANNAQRTFDQALEDLSVEFQGKGFQP